jgi:hypothetical protein
MRRICVFVGTIAFCAGLSSHAWALITNTYDPTACYAVDSGSNGNLQRANKGNHTTAKLTNPSTGFTVNVFCPIIKTTSGPGIANDQIWDANVPVTVPSGQTVQCGIEVFDNQPFPELGNNFVESSFTSLISSGTMNIGFESQFSGPSDYWDGYGTAPAWFYADIECQLPPGASLGPGFYSVDEEGAVQPNRIYPVSACSPDPANGMFWHMFDFDLGSDPQGGGLASNGVSTGPKFIWDCPAPSSSSVEFEIFPDEGLTNGVPNQTFGCSLDTRRDPQTWPSKTVDSNSSPWAFQTIPMGAQGGAAYGSPLMRTPSGGSHKFVCDTFPDTTDGDGGIYSYRTEPDWSPSSNHTGGGSTVQGAIDLNISTRWTTGTAQSNNGTYYQIDMRTAKSFSAIDMDSGGSTNDYAHGYKVYVSNNGTSWGNPIATGTPTKSPVIVTFPTQTARFIKVVQTGTDPNHWWSIAELTVFK